MQKSNVIKKNDFEKYELEIPFISMAGKKHRQFVCSELEKRHPCFSDEFAFDSVVKRISRKGLSEDVYVVNKYKLAEYENHRSFPGIGFYLENLKHRHRLFVERKWKLTFWSLIAALSIGLSGGLAGKVAGDKSLKVHETDSPGADLLVSAGEEVEADILLPFSTTFLSDVREAGGKVSRFEWSLEMKNGKRMELISASLKGVVPENLQGYSGGAVNYTNGIPFMEISHVQKIGLYNTGNQAASTFHEKMTNADFNKNLRLLISEGGASLLNEKAPPYHIEFLCSTLNEKQKKNLLQEIAGLISKDLRIVTSIKVQQLEDEKLLVGLSIEEDEEMFTADKLNVDLNSISENIGLFIDKSKKSLSSVSINKSENIKVDAGAGQAAEEKVKKIGEIKRPDNTSLLFYKTEKGKIKTVNTNLKEDL